jgi:short subunit dehydrogenase-like uncharacterized protein
MSIDPTAAQHPSNSRRVSVFGAYGHTGRFTVAHLLARGWEPILAGRDATKLAALAQDFPGLEQRVATVDDPASLDRALEGAVAVLNCAGPFSESGGPLIEAALRARIHYLDTAAEQQPVIAAFERYHDAAVQAGVAVIPAMAFYGGLADLLATAAVGDEAGADAIDIAIALDSWHPTAGTRLTGQRNTARRLVIGGGALQFLADPAPTREWTFAAPFAKQDVVALPFSEIPLIARHLRVAEVHSYLNLTPLKDLRDPATPAPVAADAHGRSAQRFAIEVEVRGGAHRHRVAAQGQDIYAVTAPLLVEALERIVDGRRHGDGVIAPGQAFDAAGFLRALAPDYLGLGGLD